MSLVFRPHRFFDKRGDMVEIDELMVIDMFAVEDDSIQMEFDGQVMIVTDMLDNIQGLVEEQWNWGRISPHKVKNISKDLRDKIKILECIMEAKGKDWTITEQLKLEMFREKLRKLQQEGEGEK